MLGLLEKRTYVFLCFFCVCVKCNLLSLNMYIFVEHYLFYTFPFYITVNVEIFVQYIFSRISRRLLDARKIDVSENYNHNRTNRINCNLGENFDHGICLLGLNGRNFSCAKLSTFTVLSNECPSSYCTKLDLETRLLRFSKCDLIN